MRHCLNCEKSFKPSTTKQVFCTTKCRVAYSRRKKERFITSDNTGAIRTPKEIAKQLSAYLFGTNQNSCSDKWIDEIRKYCEEKNITPEDLISTHRIANLGKPIGLIPTIIAEVKSSYDADRRKITNDEPPQWSDPAKYNRRKNKLGF